MKDSAVRDQSGQAVVELAITLTLLLFILFGTLDLGRAFFGYISIVNAAREGARVGSVLRDAGRIVPAAKSELTGSGLDPNQLTVTVTSWGGTMRPVVVTVSYPFHFIITGVLPFTELTLTSTATMMIQ
jgi:Flp pilus assembly protein TadG